MQKPPSKSPMDFARRMRKLVHRPARNGCVKSRNTSSTPRTTAKASSRKPIATPCPLSRPIPRPGWI